MQVEVESPNAFYERMAEQFGEVDFYVRKVPWLLSHDFLLMATMGLGVLSFGHRIYKSMRGYAMPGNDSSVYRAENVKVKFSDVKGIDKSKQDIVEFVEFLKEPGNFRRVGARLPRGALMTGSPGTGKTLIAKACAGEAGVPFFYASGSEFVEKYVGKGAARVRDLFKAAKQNSPAIIFIDEIEVIGSKRGKMGSSG